VCEETLNSKEENGGLKNQLFFAQLAGMKDMITQEINAIVVELTCH
jgi:hypothetical protein